jgi:hypothetical protein
LVEGKAGQTLDVLWPPEVGRGVVAKGAGLLCEFLEERVIGREELLEFAALNDVV